MLEITKGLKLSNDVGLETLESRLRLIRTNRKTTQAEPPKEDEGNELYQGRNSWVMYSIKEQDEEILVKKILNWALLQLEAQKDYVKEEFTELMACVYAIDPHLLLGSVEFNELQNLYENRDKLPVLSDLYGQKSYFN